jgi:small subunit ribosomal protein S21
MLPAIECLIQVEERALQVLVRDNNIDQALRVLKKKMQREGVFRELKRRRFYEKPSERLAREKSEALRRARKLARKKAQREGLLPAPHDKKRLAAKPTARAPFTGGDGPSRQRASNGSRHDAPIPNRTEGSPGSRSS